MAKAISTLTIAFDFKDAGTQPIIDKIGGSIKKLQVISGPTSQTIQKLRQQVTQLGQKGTNSISTIEGQIGALKGLRREADLNSKEFKELTADIDAYTKKLQKAQGQNKKGGLGARGTTQVAGAVISGGIFGGPEGALGALGGGILGGVEGAFAGAAIGAQLKGLRQLMAGAGEYAAQIEKLEIALKGVTRTEGDAAMSRKEFNFATAAARKVTEELNVPQAQSIAGITRLAAAVKGAGGPLSDATLTFRNVTAAIKATGGSSEDVKGAITAMVQVFSKGKVSAEELSGQLGERLPGAVTAFAKANKMTLPELQKNLKAGTVGLDELMKFIVQLGDTYGDTAKEIADSNADAGARLEVEIRDLQAAVGKELAPIGAQFQDAFARFIEEITPTLVDILPKIAQFFLDLAKNLDKVLQVALVVLAAVTVAKIVSIGGAVAALGKAMLVLATGAGTASIALAKLNAAALLNPYVALAAGVTALSMALFNAGNQQRRLNKLIASGTVAQVKAEITKKDADLQDITDELKSSPTRTKDDIVLFGEGAVAESLGARRTRLTSERARLTDRLATAEGEERAQAAKDLALLNEQFKGYGSPTAESDGSKGGGGGKGGSRAKGPKDISNLRMESQFASIIAGRNKATVEERRKALILQRQAAVKASEELTPNKQLVEILKASEAFRKGMLQIETEITEENKKQAEEARKLADARMQLRDQLGLLSPQERTKAAQDSFKNQFPGATDQDLDLIRQAFDPTDFEKIQKSVRELGKELQDLTNPANMIIKSADAIGTAFTDSFMSVITGSASTQEALSSFFKNVGKFFLDMAAQIIQKMITMFILNKVVGLLPGMSGGGLSGGGLPFGGTGAAPAGLNTAINLAGNGAYFDDGIAKFAEGGIVNSPTLFSYGDGGTGRFGLMGEAGPEAIMPLQRGSDGKLGVSVAGDMRAAMGRYRGRGTTGFASSGSESGSAGDGSSAPGGAIDVRYTVERINDVDYVTAEQFQQGMQQAAQRGATEGERRTMRSLQNSTAVRRSLAF